MTRTPRAESQPKRVMIQVMGWQCWRCDHVWAPRSDSDPNGPRVCPKCKSPYWDRPRGNHGGPVARRRDLRVVTDVG